MILSERPRCQKNPRLLKIREGISCPGLDDPCQNGEMAPLSISIFFVFKTSLLPNHCVKYDDLIVKLCSGVAFNWRVSLVLPLGSSNDIYTGSDG